MAMTATNRNPEPKSMMPVYTRETHTGLQRAFLPMPCNRSDRSGVSDGWMADDVQDLLRQRRYDEALERLLDAYEQKVFRMAVAMLRDRGRAQDVTQDIFLKLWRALPSYDGR